MERFQEVTWIRLSHYFWFVLGHAALIYLIVAFQWQMLLISLLMHYIITTFGLSMVYHRVTSHNVVKLPRIVEFIGLFLGGLSMQGSALSWAAVHVQHHRNQGTEKDPHSPRHLGSWYIHLFGYAFRKIDPRPVVRILKNKPHLYFWEKYYYKIYGFILLASLFVLPFDLALAIFFAPIAIVFQFENFINTWAHDWDNDVPSDKPMVNLFIIGEGWHKVHHDNPGQIRLHKYDVLGYLLERFFKNRDVQPN